MASVNSFLLLVWITWLIFCASLCTGKFCSHLQAIFSIFELLLFFRISIIRRTCMMYKTLNLNNSLKTIKYTIIVNSPLVKWVRFSV